MPRPRKCRRVCRFPRVQEFLPVQGAESGAPVILSVDEYETVRLIDREGFSQEQCSESMQVARTTVQQTYANARKKLAEMLVDGRPLRIEGGEFQLCDGSGCFKQRLSQMYAKEKGEAIVRIAVPYENGEIFQHFGRAEQFKLYDVADGRIAAAEVVNADGCGHGALVKALSALNVDALLCGGIGEGARTALAAAGIRLYGGAQGKADAAVEALLDGSLECDSDAHCGCGGHHCEDH